MKGIMVPLLMIFVTGTVIGQQPQRTLNQAGNLNRNPAQSRSVMDDSSTNPASVNQLGPLELVLNDQLIADFRAKGQLSAPIKPQQFVNEILLMHKNGVMSENITGSIKPTAKQGDVLRFELDDYDLESLKSQGFRYTFDQFERGRYSQVQFDYRATSSRSNSFGNSQNSKSSQFGGQTTGQQSAYLPSPSPDYSRPYDPSFMGPTRPNSPRTAAQDTYTNPPKTQNTWSPESSSSNQVANQFGNSSNGFQSTRRNDLAGSSSRNSFNSTSPTTYQPQRRFGNSYNQPSNQFAGQNKFPNSSSDLSETNRAMTTAERWQQQLEQEKAEALKQKIELERLELAELRKSNRLKEQAIRDQQRQQLTLQQENQLTRQTGNSFGKIDPNDAYNQFSPQGNQARFASLTGSEYADRVVNGYGAPPARSQNPPSQPSTNEGVRSYAGSIPGPQTGNDRPNRLATNPFNKKNVSGNINNQDAPEAGILYFMLLFSLGLNVYLGWIARGFYVRYNELADELRETFTATM